MKIDKAKKRELLKFLDGSQHILRKPRDADFLLSQVELFKIVYRILRQTTPTSSLGASNFVAKELDDSKRTPWEQYYKLQEHIAQTESQTSARTLQAWTIVQHFAKQADLDKTTAIPAPETSELKLQINATSSYRVVFFDTKIEAIIEKEIAEYRNHPEVTQGRSISFDSSI